MMEKIWTALGLKIDDNDGKVPSIVLVLYGLKLAVAIFGSHLATCMHKLVISHAGPIIVCGCTQ